MRILIVLILKADLLLYCLIVLIIFKRQIPVVFITAITWCSCALEANYFPYWFYRKISLRLIVIKFKKMSNNRLSHYQNQAIAVEVILEVVGWGCDAHVFHMNRAPTKTKFVPVHNQCGQTFQLMDRTGLSVKYHCVSSVTVVLNLCLGHVSQCNLDYLRLNGVN